ncbi:hypothetical protein [Micromonospora sp. NPDC049891]|uniref:hypothetical protein n=1 Tax=Micromonospora sp. NPDC049891 TaxID=3155655 RepID=UPI003400C87F
MKIKLPDSDAQKRRERGIALGDVKDAQANLARCQFAWPDVDEQEYAEAQARLGAAIRHYASLPRPSRGGGGR